MMENYMLLTLSVAPSGGFFYFQFYLMGKKHCGQCDVFSPILIFNGTCLIMPVNSLSEEHVSAVNCRIHTHTHTPSVYLTDECVVECVWQGRGSWLGVSHMVSQHLIKHPPQRALLLSTTARLPPFFSILQGHKHHSWRLSLLCVVQTLCCSLTNNHIQSSRVTLMYWFGGTGHRVWLWVN